MRNRPANYWTLQPILLACFFMCFYSVVCAKTLTDTTSQHRSKTKYALPWYIHRFNIEAGTFFSLNSTDIKVGTETRGTATLIDFEKDLGFKTNTLTFLAKAQWRISRRSLFELKYYNLARSSGYTLKKELDFADTTFRINTSVSSFFNTRIFEFTYGYSIISRPRYELGVKLGVHLVSARVGIATVDNVLNASFSRTFTMVKPLPDLGVWGGYSLNKRWALQGSGGYFYADKGIKKITIAHINIFTYNLLLHYKATEHLQLCAGYMGYFVKMNGVIDGITGYLDWGYSGPTLKASFVFGKSGFLK